MNVFKRRSLAGVMASALIVLAMSTQALTVKYLSAMNGMIEVSINGGSSQWITMAEFLALGAQVQEEKDDFAKYNTPRGTHVIANPPVVEKETKVALKLADIENYVYMRGAHSIATNTTGQRGFMESWIEQSLGGGQYAYVGPNGNYMEVVYNSQYASSFPVLAESKILKSSSVFTKDDLGGGAIRLKNLDGVYLKKGDDRTASFQAIPGNSGSATALRVMEIGSTDSYTIFSNLSVAKHPQHKALVIKNIPAGVAIQGKATAPTQTKDATSGVTTFHQMVDYDSYMNNELKMVVNHGFSGNIQLVVEEYYGDVGVTSGVANPLDVSMVDYVDSHLQSRDVGWAQRLITLRPQHAFAAMTGTLRFLSDAITSKKMKVSLKTRDDYYLKAEDGDVKAKEKRLEPDGIFTMTEQFNQDGKFYFTTPNADRLSGCGKDDDDPNLSLVSLHWGSSDCVLFDFFKMDNGKVAFRGMDGKHFWKALSGGGRDVRVNEGQLIDSALFTMTEIDAPNRTTIHVPLYFAVNPSIGSGASVTLTGLPSGVRVLDRHFLPIGVVSNGSITINDPDNTYYLGINAIEGSFDVGVEMSASGAPTYSKSLYIADISFVSTSDGKVVSYIPSNRNLVTVSRAGNAWVIKEKATGKTFSIDMQSSPFLLFANGPVSYAGDYSVAIDVPISPLDTFVIVHNVPYGAVINNSIALGNNAYLIFTDRLSIHDGQARIHMDTPSVVQPNTISSPDDVSNQREDLTNGRFGVGVQLTTSQHVLSVDQRTKLDGMTISGQANVKAYAEAEQGANLSWQVNGDGLAMEAGAYQHFGAVVTAGATASIDNVATMNANASAEVSVHREVSIRVAADKHNTEVAAYAGQESVATLSASGSIETPIIPGTRAETGGSVSVSSYAYVTGDGAVGYGGGKYGASAEGELAAGHMVTAEGYGNASIAGIGGGAGGGVSAGTGVGIGGGATVMYDHGEVNVGVSGDVALLLGVEADLDVTVDVNAVANTAQLIANGVVTSSEAVALGMITVARAINSYGLDVYDAVDLGYLSTEDAINKFGADSSRLSNTGYKKVKQFGKKVGNSVKFW